jgi:hypothetical protein
MSFFSVLLHSYRQAAPPAYISGNLCTLIGADLANLDKLEGLGALIRLDRRRRDVRRRFCDRHRGCAFG